MNKDKMSVIQVFGCIMKNPLIILDERYPLSVQDFPERFHKIIWGALEHLIKSGVQGLSEIDVDDFLTKYPSQYKVFTNNQGLEYLANAKELSDFSNFEYHYTTLKKFSLLNQLEEKGFDITPVYDSSIIDVKESERMQSKFDNCTLDDILDTYEQMFVEIKDKYTRNASSTGCQAGQGMGVLKEKHKSEPEMGMPMCSKKMTTICRGRRLKKLYFKTAPSGFGKTRISVGEACCGSIPEIYDPDKKKWVKTNCNEPTLFITTELEIDEIQTLIMAYVSNVPEDHILDGNYVDDEEERVDKAIKIIENSNFFIEHMPNFNIDDLEKLIKRYKVERKIAYVFFDYVFASIKIMSEVTQKTRMKMREDNVLIMFVDRMKTLANTLNIHIDTSSQSNGDWKNVKDADQNIIRGAKGMADKVDIGYVILPPTEKDKEGLKSVLNKGFFKVPNLVYHIYKVRRGKINHVKLWVYFDYGTCRTEDLFVTDNDYKLLEVENTTVELILDATETENEDDTTLLDKKVRW